MLIKTRGIVLHSLKYSENSLIIKMYTDTIGLQSFIIKSARSKRSRMKAGIFQPLSILDLIVFEGKKPGLRHIREITSAIQFEQIPYDIKKSSVVFFIAELLYKSLREETANKDLFDFISDSVMTIDRTNERISDFHLLFMHELSRYLGFFPMNNYDKKNKIFNLMDGRFQDSCPEHPYFTETSLGPYLNILFSSSLPEFSNVHFEPSVRRELVRKIIDYYRIHINGFSELNSHLVLEEVFS